MFSISLLADTELLAQVAAIVETERKASAEVVEHLVEVERRRLYLDQACSSLYAYCRERLGYSEDAALKRARVARLALRLPRALDELRTGAIHLTGLFLLDRYLNEENADGLLAEARGKSRRELEKILASRFPRPDAPSRIEPLGTLPLAIVAEASGGAGASAATGGSRQEEASGPSPWFSCPGPGTSAAGGGRPSGDFRSRLEPLSAERYRVEFTASAPFRGKIEQARELLSHALPNDDLAVLFERALDELIERELKRRVAVGHSPQVAHTYPRKRGAVLRCYSAIATAPESRQVAGARPSLRPYRIERQSGESHRRNVCTSSEVVSSVAECLPSPEAASARPIWGGWTPRSGGRVGQQMMASRRPP